MSYVKGNDMPELNECRFCASMGFGGCEMCTDSRSEMKRLKSELKRVKRENEALKESFRAAFWACVDLQTQLAVVCAVCSVWGPNDDA